MDKIGLELEGSLRDRKYLIKYVKKVPEHLKQGTHSFLRQKLKSETVKVKIFEFLMLSQNCMGCVVADTLCRELRSSSF